MNFGIMDDVSYNYCFKSLLMETKEWWQILKNFQRFMKGTSDKQDSKKSSEKKALS